MDSCAHVIVLFEGRFPLDKVIENAIRKRNTFVGDLFNVSKRKQCEKEYPQGSNDDAFGHIFYTSADCIDILLGLRISRLHLATC